MPVTDAVFWIGLTIMGTALYFIFDEVGKRKRIALFVTLVFALIIGGLAIAYAEYGYFHPKEEIRAPLWAWLLLMTWGVVAYAIYDRRQARSAALILAQGEILELKTALKNAEVEKHDHAAKTALALTERDRRENLYLKTKLSELENKNESLTAEAAAANENVRVFNWRLEAWAKTEIVSNLAWDAGRIENRFVEMILISGIPGNDALKELLAKPLAEVFTVTDAELNYKLATWKFQEDLSRHKAMLQDFPDFELARWDFKDRKQGEVSSLLGRHRRALLNRLDHLRSGV